MIRTVELLSHTQLRYVVRIQSTGHIIAAFEDLKKAHDNAKEPYLEVYDIMTNDVVPREHAEGTMQKGFSIGHWNYGR